MRDAHPEVAGCLASFAARGRGETPWPSLEDAEGEHVPEALRGVVVDAHVHIFPDAVFHALWRWFGTHAWPVRYQLQAREVAGFLLARGVDRVVALHYAHRPGIARSFNSFLAALCEDEPRVTGVATVFPGEPEARQILEEGFALGLRGVKLHCHVQAVAADDPVMAEIYALCEARGEPLVIHAGRAPRLGGYPIDPATLCHADRMGAVLRAYPRLRVCVPHLGADECDAYAALLERHDNLWLDTTMAMTDYFDFRVPPRLLTMRPDRVLYGSDFPNLPYAWDRELRQLLGRAGGYQADGALDALCGGNARLFFGLPAGPAGPKW